MLAALKQVLEVAKKNAKLLTWPRAPAIPTFVRDNNPELECTADGVRFI